jgi:hypothetical protein
MARQSEPPDRVRKILGGKGRKLHTHEIHVRRTANKGYIARHDLRDRHGHPPDDGQRGEMEYALPDQAAMLAHVQEHMGPTPPDDEGQEPGEPQEPSGPPQLQAQGQA